MVYNKWIIGSVLNKIFTQSFILALFIFSILPVVQRVQAKAEQTKVLSQELRLLNSDSFSDKLEAVQSLASLEDQRVALILTALSEGSLYSTENGLFLIFNDGHYSDVLTDKIIDPAPPSQDVSAITINNRIRGFIEECLATLDMKSPDPKKRLRAAKIAADRPSEASSKALHQALIIEKDSNVIQAITETLARVDITSDDRNLRLSALKTLIQSDAPEVLSLINSLIQTETDNQIKLIAVKAMKEMEKRKLFIEIGANIFQGLSLGSVLLLGAIGLAITFGVMGVINMAHGEMIMIGAYTTFLVQEAFRSWLPSTWFDAYLIVALPIAFIVSSVIGIILERFIIRFLYGRPLETLLSTFGISLILQQLIRSLFGAPNKAVENPSWMTGGINLIGGFTLTWNRLAIILFSIAVLISLAIVMRLTSFGLFMRAVSQNRLMAASMGIRTNYIDALTFGLGSGIAGIAGVALSQIGNVSPNLGQTYIIDSFMVVVFGGVGSLWGTLVGALSLGIINKILEPYAGAMLGKILVLIFIIFFIQKRPRGLFSLKVRSIES
jgi:urea transport system permease protein